MMFHATDSKQVAGITVLEVPNKEGVRHHATIILIDTGFTGYAIMFYSFVEEFGYE